MIWIVLLVIIGLIAYVVITYNKLISNSEEVETTKRQIDIQLDRRFKVFEGLINTVRKVMDYEQTVLKDIVQMRSDAQSARAKGDTVAQFDAEEKISQIASQINVVFEQYPQLQAMHNAEQLQEEIVSTENKLSYAKQAYNDAINNYNVSKKSFFGSIIVSMFAKRLDHDYERWQLSDTQIEQHEKYVAKL
jgi:LemA protein